MVALGVRVGPVYAIGRPKVSGLVALLVMPFWMAVSLIAFTVWFLRLTVILLIVMCSGLARGVHALSERQQQRKPRS